MISWVVMLVSRLLDYVANIDDEPSGGKKHLVGKDRERALTGNFSSTSDSIYSRTGPDGSTNHCQTQLL